MEFRFKTTEKFIEAHEFLIRSHVSFGYNIENNYIDMLDPTDEMIKKIMDICGECKDHDALLAKELMKQHAG